jgi:hypothetical protein
MRRSTLVRTARPLSLMLAVSMASLAVAVPAHAAASQTVTVSFASSVYTVSPTTVSLTVGDTLVISNTSAFDLAVKNATGQIRNQTMTTCTSVASTASGSSCPVSNTTSTSFTVLATGTVELYRFTSAAVLLNTVTIGSGGGSASMSDSPALLIQQFGMPSSGTCDAAAPVMLNWGGAGSGGWGNSWAQWANGGNGGAVCTRTLVYSNSSSRWIVG